MSETTPRETPVERRLAQFHDHIVKGLERRPDDRVTAYCSQPDVDALAAGREAIALLRQWRAVEDFHEGSSTAYHVAMNRVERDVAALLARCEGDAR